MRRHLVVALILMVVGPLALLVGLATKVLHDEEDLLRHRFRELREQRLDDSRAAVEVILHTLEVELARDLESVAVEREELRELIRVHPLARQVFITDAEGRRLHPLDDDLATQQERDFLARTRAIWAQTAELALPAPNEAEGPALRPAPSSLASAPLPSGAARSSTPPTPQQAALANPSPDPTQAPLPGQPPAADSLAGLARVRPGGWIAWYWEEGLHLLYWHRRADGRIAGVEVERAVLLQRLIAGLPATTDQESLVVLADAQGAPVYQWGTYDPPADARPLARVALPAPLDAWKLLYLASEESDAPAALQSSRLVVGIGVVASGLVLCGLALFLHREWSRGMREARQRVSFVTQVSHELKTPLTNIRLYAELLADDVAGVDDKAEERAQVIVAECERLSRLIGNVLTFSRQGHGAPPRAHPVDLEALVRATLDHFRPAFAERGIAIHEEGAAPRPVLADDDAVGQILANLLSNVEKYAAAGRRVDIALAQDPRSTRVAVRDHGPGVPEAHRARIFDPFYRVRDDLREGASGTGIGLTIARDLARQLGGDLTFEPCQPGARFTLTLKSAPPEEPHEGADRRG